MGIRRSSNWKTATTDHSPIIRTSSSGASSGTDTKQTPVVGVPGKKGTMEQVSEFRREMFAEKTNDTTSSSVIPVIVYSPSYKAAQNLKNSFTKTATSVISGAGSTFGQSSSSSTVRQAPEVYSPLFQMANLQLPRDRITMNAWNRNFYITHPLVHNCINLHATYPISKINIKCKDSKIEQFFNDMAEDMDLIGTLQAIALEYWKLGEKIQGSSLITMADGSLCPISDIKIGDMVLTHLGNKKRVIDRFVKPTNTVIEEHLKIYKVFITGLPEPLIISGRHPMLLTKENELKCHVASCSKKNIHILPDKNKCGNCGKKNDLNIVPDFAAANSASAGDFVYAPFNQDVIKDDAFNTDLCYLMGFWLAEGSYCKSPRKNYTKYNGVKVTNFNDNYLSNVLMPMFEHQMGFAGKKYTSISTHFAPGKFKYDYWYEGEFRGGPKLADFFLKHCGEYSKTKRLSETVMNLPIDLQLDLLAGAIDGDGCVDKSNGRIIICTSSRDLANQYVLILRRAGAHPTYTKVQSKVGTKLGGFNYRISISANESKSLFGNRLKSDKRFKFKPTPWTSNHTSIYKGWQILSIERIEDITDQFDEDFMYDIEVEDDHSYVANGMAVHNCFPYAQLDEKLGRWKSIVVLNPDYVHVKKSPLGDFSLSMRPDAALLKLIQSSNPDDLRLVNQIDPEIVYHIRKGNNIPLDNFHVSHLKRQADSSDIHGTSIIVSIYKDLMLYDKLRESKFAQADNLVNPITLIKVGGATEGEYHPTSEDLENYRQVFEAATYDKDFKIITHAGVTVERVGASGQIIDIAPDMNFIVDNICFGLMVPKNILIQEGAAFQSATIGLEVLKQRYESFRNMMGRWLIRKVFAPISELQEFYSYKDGEKKLIVPEIDWNKLALYDVDNYINVIKELANNPQNPMVSKNTLFHSLGINVEEENRRIKEEAINTVILQKELQILQSMSLGALRSLKPESDIIEGTTEPLPGTVSSPMSEESGMLPGGGLGELGLPAAPSTETAAAPPTIPGGVAGAPPAATPTTTGPVPKS